ncbi:MAG TPA: nucleotidyltransferase domain-containing protein [Reyranella sp.]|nr:nucleotidyltransferase domain-containing protein [Reyranella sp.]
MNRDAIVAAIRSEEAALKRAGVKSLALVGSSARDTRNEVSDVDVLIDVVDETDFSLMDRISIIHLLGDALRLPVDVSRRDTLNPLVRERMVKDAIKIF